MKEAAISFLLLLAVETVMAVARYLKDRMMSHLHRDQHDHHHGFQFEPEY